MYVLNMFFTGIKIFIVYLHAHFEQLIFICAHFYVIINLKLRFVCAFS